MGKDAPMMKDRFTDEAKRSHPRRSTLGPAIVGLILGLSSVGATIARWLHAVQIGDTSEASQMAVSMAIGFPSVIVLLVGGTLIFLLLPSFGLYRARRLRSMFPNKVVIPVLRPRTFGQLRGTLLSTKQRASTFSLTVVADEAGLQIWSGIFRYRRCGAASADAITKVGAKEFPPPGSQMYLLSIDSREWPVPFDVGIVQSPWLLTRSAPIETPTVAANSLSALWHLTGSSQSGV